MNGAFFNRSLLLDRVSRKRGASHGHDVYNDLYRFFPDRRVFGTVLCSLFLKPKLALICGSPVGLATIWLYHSAHRREARRHLRLVGLQLRCQRSHGRLFWPRIDLGADLLRPLSHFLYEFK